MGEVIERWDGAEDVVEEFRSKYQFPFLDEFIADNVDIHFEAMGHAQFWMHVKCRDTGREWHLNFGAVSTRVKGYAFAEEDTMPTPSRGDETTPGVGRGGEEGAE